MRASDFPKAFSLEQMYGAKSVLCRFFTVKFICHVNELIIDSVTRYFSPWYSFVSALIVNNLWQMDRSRWEIKLNGGEKAEMRKAGREKEKVQVISVNWKKRREISSPVIAMGDEMMGWKTIPSVLYQVFSGLGKASTMHCNRTWLSTGAATMWFTALTDGGTGRESEENRFSIN